MQYKINYLPDINIVDVKMQGRLSYQIAESFSKDAIKLARENDCFKFLINFEKTFIIFGVTNLFATGSELQQFGFKSSDKIAIVMHEVSSYKSSVDQEKDNVNLSQLKFFNSDHIEDALNWLNDN